ncbi:MAG: glycosyl hydrolase [Ignavibacteria bacterium]|nr:MAG: glycosyl hydrolase family 26 [Chlorobi bacterium OLB4]MBV6397776.1 Endoglucanase H [Ignavibacteria bacterium]MBW7855658.1 hypothetical protein [Ignavibacteria bacterium]
MSVFLSLTYGELYSQKLLAPESGIYHAAFPGMGATEDVVTEELINDFVSLAGKEITWVYFSNNWFNGIKFPVNNANEIRNSGRVPFIRIMPRSDWRTGELDPRYSLERILSGEYDDSIRLWFKEAKTFGSPLLVEFGTEVNGNWFPWSAVLNSGPEVFVKTYRHIIDLSRDSGADNITWFLHLNGVVWPVEEWNKFSNYYPGDEYIDWIGVSIYGSQIPGEDAKLLTNSLSEIYDELSSITESKPIAILEFATVENSGDITKSAWITDALNGLANGNFPRIKAVSWWHSNFVHSNGDLADMRIDSSEESLTAYRNAVSSEIFISVPLFNDQ